MTITRERSAEAAVKCQRHLAIIELRTDLLSRNPWNPNRMTPEIRRKLRRNLKRDGFVAPILVRKLGDRFQIINGEHRWKIAKELKYQTIPCVVLDKQRAIAVASGLAPPALAQTRS